MDSYRELLEAALVGYQSQREQIDAKVAEIQRELGTAPARGSAAGSGKRVISAAGRRRMAEAQRKRWAAAKGEPASAPAKKRKMSAAGKKRIADATRKRWAAYRAQKAAAMKKGGKAAAKRPAAKKTAAPAEE
jgi:hypothetical protein